MSSNSGKGVISSFGKLHISKDKQKAEPLESWEDEDSSEDTETEDEHQHHKTQEGTATPTRPGTSYMPGAPPPTPSSPSDERQKRLHYQSFSPLDFGGAFDPVAYSSSSVAQDENRRPDKTTSVASRLIAAGIGQKAPKRTQEQREYDQAMKIQEKKRRDHAKEEEERKKREKAQAQKDIWGD